MTTEIIRIDTQEGAVSTFQPYNDMQQASEALKTGFDVNTFQVYRRRISDNTKKRQHDDIVSFNSYLATMGIARDVQELEAAPASWYGIDATIVKGFQLWLEGQGYAMGTINVRLSTIRKYCQLLKDAKVINQETLTEIQAVQNKNGSVAINTDKDREKLGIARRRGYKKELATQVTTNQVFKLKHTTTNGRGKQRATDILIEKRDALLTGLIFEHALRCGEIVSLNIEHFNLTSGTMEFYREKTNIRETHALKQHTRNAAEDYIAALKTGIAGKLEAHTSGPLFTGYQGKRISKRAINARMEVLGQEIGIEKLSPHDGRHYWAFDALRNGTSLDKVVSGGGWRSPEMALRYAKRASVANEGVKISEE